MRAILHNALGTTGMTMQAIMTYEEYLDEVTTLMTEKFDMSDEAAIKHVMRAQAADFFTLHDETPSMRTQERAEQDAQTIFDMKNKSRAHVKPTATKPRPPRPPRCTAANEKAAGKRVKKPV